MIAIGITVAALGWVFLVGFVGTRTGFGGEIINLHLLQVANNVIHLGYFIVLCGIVHSGFKLISDSTAIKAKGKPKHSDNDVSTTKNKTRQQIAPKELDRLSEEAEPSEDAKSIEQWKRQSS